MNPKRKQEAEHEVVVYFVSGVCARKVVFLQVFSCPDARSIVRLASIHAAITAAEAQDLAVVLLATPSFHAPGS